MSTIDNPLLVACRLALERVALLMSGVAAVAVMVGFAASASLAQDVPPTESEAAVQYVANLKRLLEARIVPDLRRAIPETSSSRPPALRIDVIADASPYDIESHIAPDGSLTVRLSIGYVTLRASDPHNQRGRIGGSSANSVRILMRHLQAGLRPIESRVSR